MIGAFLAAVSPARALRCEQWGAVENLDPMDAVASAESSGLAESRLRPGTWFTHDDANGQPVLHAFDLDGASHGTHAVEGAGFRDWEDLSAGPCPDGAGGRCLYIGDVGDNHLARTSIAVYAVEEPTEDGQTLPVIATWTAEWPGEVQDCETLFVHPRTGRVYLASKNAEGITDIVRFPEAPGEGVSTLEPVASIDLLALGPGDGLATGADWDPDGERLVLRTYGTAWEWATDPCDEGAHWSDAPQAVSLSGAPGGEAIAWSLDGRLVLSAEGTPLQVSTIPCEALVEEAVSCGADEQEEETAGSGCGCARGGAAVLLPAPWLRRRRSRPVDSASKPMAGPTCSCATTTIGSLPAGSG